MGAEETSWPPQSTDIPAGGAGDLSAMPRQAVLLVAPLRVQADSGGFRGEPAWEGGRASATEGSEPLAQLRVLQLRP